jgi:hypothetical protein
MCEDHCLLSILNHLICQLNGSWISSIYSLMTERNLLNWYIRTKMMIFVMQKVSLRSTRDAIHFITGARKKIFKRHSSFCRQQINILYDHIHNNILVVTAALFTSMNWCCWMKNYEKNKYIANYACMCYIVTT